MPSFGKRTPLTTDHFTEFEIAYTASDRASIKNERWTRFTRDEIGNKDNSLDLGLMQVAVEQIDWSTYDPTEQVNDAADLLEEAIDLLRSLATDLQADKEA